MFGVHLSLRIKVYLYSFKSLNFDFHSLIGVSDSEVFIVLILIYFSFLIHVKISATWGGRSPPHQSRTAYISLKKMFNLNPKAYTQGPCLNTVKNLLKAVLRISQTYLKSRPKNEIPCSLCQRI